MAFTTDPQRIFHLDPPETTDSSEISEMVQFVDGLIFEVETGWEGFSPELQDALTRFAYRDRGSPQSFWQSLVGRLRLAVIVLRGETELLNELWNSANRLREATLDAIERSNPEYQKDLGQAVEDAFSETGGRTMNAEQARERNRQIFDQVFD